MGLDLGFTIYKKERDNEGKLLLRKVEFPKDREDDAWSCGRCDVNYSWDFGGEQRNGKIIRPTFDEELNNYTMPQTEEAKKCGFWPETLRYVPFEEFKEHVEAAINETIEEGLDTVRSLRSQIAENEEEIKELRQLQKECKPDNEFAFNKWAEEISELKRQNSNLAFDIDSFEEEDYDNSKARSLRTVLQYLEECQEEGYVCIPWFSD